MEKSIVYFTDFRCPVGSGQLDKLRIRYNKLRKKE